MVTAKLTSKGQITIPRSVRQSLHLQTGDRVLFVINGQDEAVLKPITKSVDEVFGILHKAGMPAMSIEDMKTAVKGRHRRRTR